MLGFGIFHVIKATFDSIWILFNEFSANFEINNELFQASLFPCFWIMEEITNKVRYLGVRYLDLPLYASFRFMVK